MKTNKHLCSFLRRMRNVQDKNTEIQNTFSVQ